MRVFEVREESLCWRRLPQISIFLVRDNADYFNILRADWQHFVHHPEALPDRISAREVFSGKALIDDSDSEGGRARGLCVLCGEGTPGDDGNSERCKVGRANCAENRLFLYRRPFEILAYDRILPCIAL